MTNPYHYFRHASCLFALAISLASPCSYAQQNHVGATTVHGDPAQIVRQALLPLFQQKSGADKTKHASFRRHSRHLLTVIFLSKIMPEISTRIGSSECRTGAL